MPRPLPAARGSGRPKLPPKRAIVPAAQEERVFEAVPPYEVILRLVTESVLSRIRLRALLQVLETEHYDYETYAEAYKTLRERDFAALHSQMMLSNEDFLTLFADWRRSDLARYGTSPANKRKRQSRRARVTRKAQS
jgi:hypothetical protein